jgi:hypothetical protein
MSWLAFDAHGFNREIEATESEQDASFFFFFELHGSFYLSEK